jgi:queuine tRNA-ribosyltransferase
MSTRFGFAIEARDGAARAGSFATPHGVVPTPAFLPVATYGAVRGLEAATLRAIGARILLANTYHLHERPGEQVVAALGGLHGFSGWSGPWLTDSGGYQVTSLGDRAVVSEEGVAFASARDGARPEL